MKWTKKTQDGIYKGICASLLGALAITIIVSAGPKTALLGALAVVVGVAALLGFMGLMIKILYLFDRYEPDYKPWFAWRPVKLWHGGYVWLEHIERRRAEDFNTFYQEKGYER